MEKELNPNLFAAGATAAPGAEGTRELGNGWYFDPTSNFRGSDRGVDRAEIHRIEVAMGQLSDKVQETVKTTTLKTEKLGQKLAQLDQRTDATVQEMRAKYATLSGKITERNLMDSEVQALLERHNQIIRNFENRMTALQRVVDAQQLQLMNSQATLEEARREIARLKRV